MLAAGRSNRAIATQLVVSLDTVKKHVSHVLEKLAPPIRTEAVARARGFDLISENDPPLGEYRRRGSSVFGCYFRDTWLIGCASKMSAWRVLGGRIADQARVRICCISVWQNPSQRMVRLDGLDEFALSRSWVEEPYVPLPRTWSGPASEGHRGMHVRTAWTIRHRWPGS